MTWFSGIDYAVFLKQRGALSYGVMFNTLQSNITDKINVLSREIRQLQAGITSTESQLEAQKEAFDKQVKVIIDASYAELQRYLMDRTGLTKMAKEVLGYYRYCPQVTASVLAFAEPFLNKLKEIKDNVVQRDADYCSLCDSVLKRVEAYILCAGRQRAAGCKAVDPDELKASLAKIGRCLLSVLNQTSEESQRVQRSIAGLLEVRGLQLNTNQQQHILSVLKVLINNRAGSYSKQLNSLTQSVLETSKLGKYKRSKNFRRNFNEGFSLPLLDNQRVASDTKSQSVSARHLALLFPRLDSGQFNRSQAGEILDAMKHEALYAVEKEKAIFVLQYRSSAKPPAVTAYVSTWFCGASRRHAIAAERGITHLQSTYIEHQGSGHRADPRHVEDQLMPKTQGTYDAVRALRTEVRRYTSTNPDSVCCSILPIIDGAGAGQTSVQEKYKKINQTGGEIATLRSSKNTKEQELAVAEKLLDVVKFTFCSAVVTYLKTTSQARDKGSWRHGTKGANRALKLYNAVCDATDINHVTNVVSAQMKIAAIGGLKSIFMPATRCRQLSLNTAIVVAMSAMSQTLFSSDTSPAKLDANLTLFRQAWKLQPATPCALLSDNLKRASDVKALQRMNLLCNSDLKRTLEKSGEIAPTLRSNTKRVARGLSEAFARIRPARAG